MVSTQNNTVSRSKVDITGVPETMLQTLYARAKESRKPDHAIYDGKAIEIVDSLDYDFSLADKDLAMGSGVIARTIVLDKLVSEFLKKHKGAVVVNIASGLDTRCYRNEGKYKGWYNIDLPETMTVRAKFLQEDGPVYQIAESAMDGKWADMVEYAGEPVLVIIEGLTMYLNIRHNRQEIYSCYGARRDYGSVHGKAYQGEIHPWKPCQVFLGRVKWKEAGGDHTEIQIHRTSQSCRRNG